MSDWVDKGVTYGVRIVEPDTNVAAPLSSMAGMPTAGLTNNYSIHLQFRITTSLADSWAATDIYALELYHTDNNLDAFQIRQTGAEQISVRLKLNDNVFDTRMLYFNVGAQPAGTLFDFRVRKSDNIGENGLFGQCRVDGGAPIELSATDDCTADHGEPIDVLSIGSPANNNTDRMRGEYSLVSIYPYAVDNTEMNSWPVWSQPVPITPADHMNPPFVHVPAGTQPPENPEVRSDVFFQTNFANDVGWDMANNSTDKETGEWYQPNIPQGFFMGKAGGVNTPELDSGGVTSRLMRVELDPVYGNPCFRKREMDEYWYDENGDLQKASNTFQGLILNLPFGTRTSGYSEFYIRFNLRWPTNMAWSGRQYDKLFRLVANSWVPNDIVEDAGLPVQDSGHGNPCACETIVAFDGGETYNNRAWYISNSHLEDAFEGGADARWNVGTPTYPPMTPAAGNVNNIAPSTNIAYGHGTVSDHKFISQEEQEYHTIEFHFKANSGLWSDDSQVRTWFDGALQIADGDRAPWGTPEHPQARISEKANSKWKGTFPNPDTLSLVARGVGFNQLQLDNASDVTKNWYNRVDGDSDGGMYIKDIVMATNYIGHDYQVGEFFQDRGKGADRHLQPGTIEIFPAQYRSPNEFEVGWYTGDKRGSTVIMFGFWAYQQVSVEWWLYRDSENPDAVNPEDWVNGELLVGGDGQWRYQWGAKDSAQSWTNNGHSLHWTDSNGITLDENGYYELRISNADGESRMRERVNIVVPT